MRKKILLSSGVALITSLLSTTAYVKDASPGDLPVSAESMPAFLGLFMHRTSFPLGAPAPLLPAAPESAWVSGDKEQFSTLLAGQKADFFIAPIESRANGLDRSTRSLMTAFLSAALVENFGEKSLDTYLVQRALGEGHRKLDQEKVQRLANDTGALKRLVVEAGHDEGANLRVKFHYSRRATPSDAWSEEISQTLTIPILENLTYAETFRVKAIPEIVKAIGLKPLTSKTASTTAIATTAATVIKRLPDNLDQARSVAAMSRLNESILYQVLGTISPGQPERARERLFEKSLVALHSSGVKGEFAAYLEARANLYLHSRPAALKSLGQPKNAEGIAFRAFANGNLPEMEKAISGVKNEVSRLMLEIELQDLRQAYDVALKTPVPAYVVTALNKRPFWQALFLRRLQEHDVWSVQSNVQVKWQLDQSLPVEGLDLETKVRNLQAKGQKIDELELGMSALEHIRRARGPAMQACQSSRPMCLDTVYLDMLEANLISNVAKLLHKTAKTQGNYELAEKMGEYFSAYLSGNPDFALAMANVLHVKSVSAAPELRPAIIDKIKAQASLAAYWEQGQTETSVAAGKLLDTLNLKTESKAYFSVYAGDMPLRPYWVDRTWYTSFTGQTQDALYKKTKDDVNLKLAYAQTDISLALAIAQQRNVSDAELKTLKSEVEGRFLGSPSRAGLMEIIDKVQDTEQNRIKKYELAMRQNPDTWSSYRDYADYLISTKNDYRHAKEIFLKYPGFKRPDIHGVVEVSNEAAEAGNTFFWSGYTEDAKIFYKIAADLDTGSGSSHLGAIRQNLLKGDYEKVATLSLHNAQRYDLPWSYSDYMAWQFVFGKNQQGWDVFNQIKARLRSPEAWRAADIGYRIEQRSWENIRARLLEDEIKSVKFGVDKPAITLAVLHNSVDRMPAADLPEVMKLIEGKATGNYLYPPMFTVPFESGGQVVPPVSPFSSREKTKIAAGELWSDSIMFADAYLSFRNQNYKEAAEKFYKMEAFYPLNYEASLNRYAYTLPYFSWSSAKTGDPYKLEAYLDKIGVLYYAEHDYYLSKAIFSGMRRETATALQYLTLASNNRRKNGNRLILKEYQWAETCEMLFEATNDKKYRDLALKWSKTYQKLDPVYAWPYAIEAKLTSSPEDRLRALGIALYLDPGSERANAFPENLRQQAKKWFASHNPFARTAGVTRTDKRAK